MTDVSPEVSPDVQSPPQTTVELVRALTTAAGLAPSAAEIESLAVAYPILRGAADRLQAIAGDTDPAPVFNPVPMFQAARDA
ncbi:MAG TPA: hypothetical protein VK817_25755 [Trebonia sp.]|jgi:hypothetical protein|nr:hypothetical protein [Trebonia sp.]